MIEKTRQLKIDKSLLENVKEYELLDPKILYFPVTNGRCSEGEVYVKEGDIVNKFQKIGERKGPFFTQPIITTVSGKVLGIEKKFHKSGKLVDCIKIENDMKYTLDSSVKERKDEEINKLTKEEFAEICKNTALVGLGGSSFPTYIKFQTTDPIDTVIINGIECEPYLYSDHKLILDETEKIIKGTLLAIKCFNAKKGLICIKKKYDDLYDTLIKASCDYPEIEIKKVGNFYPQGWEIAMIKSATGIKVKPGTLPAKYGIINFNVTTIAAFYEAVKYNIPVEYRYVQVMGNGITSPTRFKVRVGTPFSDLLKVCEGYKGEGDKVFIVGGPMMGSNLLRDDFVLTKTVTNIIVNNDEKIQSNPCVRCGSCVYSCPVGLIPVTIMNAYKANDEKALKKLNVKSCIECGMCSYSCTSKIELTDYMRKAKKAVH